MDVPVRITEKRKSVSDAENEEDLEASCKTSSSPGAVMGSPRNSLLDQDKRVRREIANSNERRRMQSINAGFQSLRTLIPHHDGEKMSKAGILQQGAEYIQSLESDKTRLLSQNAQLKQMVRDLTNRLTGNDSDSGSNASPPPKRKKRDTESSDEGIAGMGYIEDTGIDDLKREMIDLRNQLDRERRLRMKLEEDQRSLEAQLYPERIRQIVSQVQETKLRQSEVAPPATPRDPPPATARVDDTQSMPPPPEPMDDHKVRMHYAEEQRHLQEQQERRMAHQKPQDSRPSPPLNSSMSRRNLETIVEAIRHLEGDTVLQTEPGEVSTAGRVRHPHHKIVRRKVSVPDESLSEKESSGSEVEDCSSSGRDSPLCLTVNSARMVAPPVSAAPATATAAFVSLPSFVQPLTTADRYPIAMQLLHHAGLPTTTMIHAPHMAAAAAAASTRPGVIVQKSS